MDILSSRILLRPRDRRATSEFYRDKLGLAICREFGDPNDPGVVFFLGGGFLEVSGQSDHTGSSAQSLWLQVRDVGAELERLESIGVQIVRPPIREPWRLIEMWIADPDGVRIVLVQVPPDHPLRRDLR